MPLRLQSTALWNTVSNTALRLILPREKPCHQDFKGTISMWVSYWPPVQKWILYWTLKRKALNQSHLCPWPPHAEVPSSSNTDISTRAAPPLSFRPQHSTLCAGSTSVKPSLGISMQNWNAGLFHLKHVSSYILPPASRPRTLLRRPFSTTASRKAQCVGISACSKWTTKYRSFSEASSTQSISLGEAQMEKKILYIIHNSILTANGVLNFRKSFLTKTPHSHTHAHAHGTHAGLSPERFASSGSHLSEGVVLASQNMAPSYIIFLIWIGD